MMESMRSGMSTLARWFRPKKKPAVVEPLKEETWEEKLERRREEYRQAVRNALKQASAEMVELNKPILPRFPLMPYVPPAGILPANLKPAMGMDAAWKNLAMDDNFVLNSVSGVTASVLDGLGFPGFPYLTELTQLTEYRDMTERTAAEMVRKWVKLKSTSEDDKSEKIERIEEAFKRHHIRDHFKDAATLDGFMGRAQIFVNLGDVQGPELETPLMINKYKIKQGSLRGFKVIEPITTYPASYNASNPLAEDYYKPSAWFVYGQKVHASRLLNFVSRPLPDLLKPVYNFSGMSMSQLAQPYVDYWLGTRDSVGKLLRNFSITVLKTNLDVLLSPSGDELIKRVQLFTQMRDNQGVFMVGKNDEDLTQLNTPLSGLDKLQAQAQEHMAAVAKTPLVILLGITPTGLNASAEGDIRIYYDYVAEQQEKLFRKNLETVLKIVQLDEFGEIDETITFDFVSLFEMTGKEVALIRKSDADMATELVQVGVLTPEEVRQHLANDPDSGYNNLDVSDIPGAPDTDLDTPDEGLKQAAGIAGEVIGKAGEATGNNTMGAMEPEPGSTSSDGGFRGNQHIGGISDADTPTTKAMKLTSAASRATKEAQKLGTRRAHAAAHAAHRRALEAHQSALSSAQGEQNKTVHQTYIDAHRSSKALHRMVM